MTHDSPLAAPYREARIVTEMKSLSQNLQAEQEAACLDPNGFWGRAALELSWSSPYQAVVPSDDNPSWFHGGALNTCYNAIDRHVEAGRGDHRALIAVSAMTDSQETLSFSELQAETARVAGALRLSGVAAGDRVVIYMPMVAEAIIAMLACARIGAVHSVVFGGFAAPELAKRLEDASPVVLLTASCGFEPGRTIEYLPLVAEAVAAASLQVVVLQRVGHERPLHADWQAWGDWTQDVTPADPVPVDANHPLYILYTSGTTGTPKGVVRESAGHAVALLWSMKNVFGVTAGDVFWAASDIGWVVGHSYIVYGPLLAGCATVVYEGKPVGTPDCAAFWRIIAANRVTAFFTAPTAIRAIRREDPEGSLASRHSLPFLKTIFLAGERTDPETLAWTQRALDRPVVDNWWQTELGWPALGRCVALDDEPQSPGSAGRPVPGYSLAILDKDGQECAETVPGDVAIKLPLPPGAANQLWNKAGAFETHYLGTYPGYYLTGDIGYVDSQGCFFVMGRRDDLINVAGHRLSTGAIEAAALAADGVVECAVVGRVDALKGQVPVAFAVPRNQQGEDDASISARVVAAVRDGIGAVASLKEVHVVQRLPKTRSGKILRKSLAELLNGHALDMPATIEDPAVLEQIHRQLS